jgi:hypothetical protein
MDTPKILIEALFEKGEVYSKTSYELAKLKSLETSIRLLTAMISRGSVVIALSLFVLVLNIGVALWLGDLLGKSYFGFFIIAGFYLLVSIVLHFFLQKWIKKPINDLIITQVLQ